MDRLSTFKFLHKMFVDIKILLKFATVAFSVISSQNLNNFNSHDSNNYPLLVYILNNVNLNYIILIIM